MLRYNKQGVEAEGGAIIWFYVKRRKCEFSTRAVGAKYGFEDIG